jgi:hypothetical protein
MPMKEMSNGEGQRKGFNMAILGITDKRVQ